MVSHNKNQNGFTITELMAVVLIISIIAATALPAYKNYTARAQVSEGIMMTASMKIQIVEWIRDKESLPASVNDLTSTTSGQYVESISISGTPEQPEILATFKDNGVVSDIRSKTVGLVSMDRGLNWECTGTVDSTYLPKNCL